MSTSRTAEYAALSVAQRAGFRIPAAGFLYILPRERGHWIDVPVTEAVAVITRWGAGTSELLKAMR